MHGMILDRPESTHAQLWADRNTCMHACVARPRMHACKGRCMVPPYACMHSKLTGIGGLKACMHARQAGHVNAMHPPPASLHSMPTTHDCASLPDMQAGCACMHAHPAHAGSHLPLHKADKLPPPPIHIPNSHSAIGCTPRPSMPPLTQHDTLTHACPHSRGTKRCPPTPMHTPTTASPPRGHACPQR